MLVLTAPSKSFGEDSCLTYLQIFLPKYPDLCKEAQRVLDSMYSASLPQKIHVQDLVNKELPFYYNGSSNFSKRYTKRAGRAMLVPPNPVETCHRIRDKKANSAGFMMFVDNNICRSGIHSNCFTCKKPPKGYTGCSMCKQSGSTESTSPVQLIAAESGRRIHM